MAATKLSRTLGSGSATDKFTYSTWLKYSGWVAGGQRWFSTVGTGDKTEQWKYLVIILVQVQVVIL